MFLIPEQVGGTEIYVRTVLPTMLGLDLGIELVVFTNRENHDTFGDFDRVPINVGAQSRPARVFAEQVRLPRAASRAGIDVLYPLIDQAYAHLRFHGKMYLVLMRYVGIKRHIEKVFGNCSIVAQEGKHTVLMAERMAEDPVGMR